MSGSTSIQWTDATWNPVRGCSRVSEGCRHCYAERQAARFVKPGQPFHGFAKVTAPRDDLDRVGGRRNGWTGRVDLVPSALDWPLRWRGDKRARDERRPSRIFVNSMSDLFHERLSDEAIAAVFGVMAACPQHTFQVLTKRPERLARLFNSGLDNFEELVSETACNITRGDHPGLVELPLPNVWLGVSVEDQATADERIPLLLQCPAAVRFVSAEPLLAPVSFRWFPAWPENAPTTASNPHSNRTNHLDGLRRLDWIIVGGESGPGARPFDLAWARAVVEQCKAAGVACFVKQLGARPWRPVPDHEFDPPDKSVACGCGTCDGTGVEPVFLRDRKGGDWSEWPEDLRVREFPTVHRSPRPKNDSRGENG